MNLEKTPGRPGSRARSAQEAARCSLCSRRSLLPVPLRTHRCPPCATPSRWSHTGPAWRSHRRTPWRPSETPCGCAWIMWSWTCAPRATARWCSSTTPPWTARRTAPARSPISISRHSAGSTPALGAATDGVASASPRWRRRCARAGVACRSTWTTRRGRSRRSPPCCGASACSTASSCTRARTVCPSGSGSRPAFRRWRALPAAPDSRARWRRSAAPSRWRRSTGTS